MITTTQKYLRQNYLLHSIDMFQTNRDYIKASKKTYSVKVNVTQPCKKWRQISSAFIWEGTEDCLQSGMDRYTHHSKKEYVQELNNMNNLNKEYC